MPGIMLSSPGTTGGETPVLAGGAEGREARGKEPYLFNEIRICFTFINFLFQPQGVTPGT